MKAKEIVIVLIVGIVAASPGWICSAIKQRELDTARDMDLWRPCPAKWREN